MKYLFLTSLTTIIRGYKIQIFMLRTISEKTFQKTYLLYLQTWEVYKVECSTIWKIPTTASLSTKTVHYTGGDKNDIQYVMPPGPI